MNDILLDIINIAQLEVLGFQKEHIFLLVLFLSLFVISIIVKPIITILTYKKYTFVLMYVVASMMLIIISFVMSILNDNLIALKIGIQAIMLFGFSLALYLLYQLLKRQGQGN